MFFFSDACRRSAQLSSIALLSCLLATGVAFAINKSSTKDEVSNAEIERLVRQLGSEHYIRREQARIRLSELGVRAFDALHAVTSDSDTEIRMQAESLLRVIQVELTREDDPPDVRRELERFGRVDAAAKLDVLDWLAALPDDRGREALCRIARFHRSEFIGKRAALAFFDVDRPISPVRAKRLQAIIHEELETSQRTAASWLRIYGAYLEDPRSNASKWNDVLIAEEEHYRDSESSTQRTIIRDLLKWHAHVMGKLGRTEETLQAIHRIIPQFVKRPVDVLNHLDWLTKFEAWKTIDLIGVEHQDAIELNVLMQYQVARSHLLRGDEAKAKRLADAAFNMTTNAAVRIIIADELLNRSAFDWFERELRAVIDDESSDDMAVLQAKVALYEKFHDWEQYAESAEVLGGMISTAEGDESLAKKLSPEYWDYLRSMRNVARARLLRGKEGKSDERRELLEKALQQNDENIDVLIELYHLPDNSETYQEELKLQVARRVREYQSLIDDESANYRQRGFGSRKELAKFYNEYAWLVANTIGDFDQALEYSKRSLELRPNSPDYLDTLARCYYATKNYEVAVIHQRKAVREKPFLGQVYRQLLLFEKAYAEHRRDRSEDETDRSS